MIRVLVTGGNGFIGRQCLIQLIEKGYEVHAITTRNEKKQFDGIHWHQADLHNRRQTSNILRQIKPSLLLHLAWYTEHGNYWNSEENIKWIQTTLAILKEFAECGGRRIVCAGTCAEYDWSNEICSENSPMFLPSTIYGRAKLATQILLETLARKYQISYAWGRIFMVYGPGEKQERFVPTVIKSLMNNIPALCTHGNQIRDYLFVNDVAAAFIKLIEVDINAIVNIGSGQPVKIRTIVEEIANQLGKKNLVRLGAIETLKTEPKKIVANIEILQKKFEFNNQYNLKDGIAKTIIEAQKFRI